MFRKEDLPSKWEIKKLSEICDVRDGTHDSPKYKNEGYPLITSKNVTNGFIDFSEVNLISKEDYDKVNKRSYVDDGDVLMPMIGTIGNPVIVKKERDFAIKNVALIKFTASDVSNKYIKLFLESIHFKHYIKRINRGGTQKFISLKDIRNFPVILPPLKTQNKIVEIMEKAEKLKEWRAEADKLADEYLKSIFLEMFGDPVKNGNSWKITNLKEIASFDKKSIKAELIDENSNYIGLEHLESGTGKILEISSAKSAGLKSNKYLFDDNCVLYGKLRPYLNKVALPTFEGVCSTDILPIKPKEEKSNKYFIKSLLSLDYYVKKATEQSTGANLPRISPKALENFKVYFPPIELQNQFAKIVQLFEEIKNYQSQSKQEIDNLFNALMQKAFKGELVC